MTLGAAMLVVGLAVSGQTQVGALYVGTRPMVNKANCNDSRTVDVQFNAIAQATSTGVIGSVPSIPYGVIYWQDVSIPSAPITSSSSSSGGVTSVLTSPVTCTGPSTDNILLDNIPLNPTGTNSFTLTGKGVVKTVGELLGDLCNSTTGVRKRRAVCLGIRNGQGASPTGNGGDGPDIDTQPPNAIGGISAEGGDSTVIANISAPSGLDVVEAAEVRYIVEYRQCTPDRSLEGKTDAGSSTLDGSVQDAAVADAAVAMDASVQDSGAGSDGGDLDASASSTPDAAPALPTGPCGDFQLYGDRETSPVRLTGLQNDVTWEVRARAVDGAGNEGPQGGGSAFATTRKEYGFLDLYGQPIYGNSCQSAGGGLASCGLFAVCLRVLARRRNAAKRSV